MRVILIAVLLVIAAAPAQGQVILGRLVDDATSQPVGMGEVLLRGGGRAVGAPAVTDSLGRFTLRAPAAGVYRLRAQRLGYHQTDSPELSLRAGDTVRVELRVSTTAVVLAPLSVTAAPRNVMKRTALDEFNERRRRGWGRFVTPEDVALRRPLYATDLLQAMAGVYVQGYPRPVVGMRGTFGRCLPTVFVDGMLMRVDQDFTLDDVLPGHLIRAMEIYRPPSVPAEFQRGTSCGAIVLWSVLRIPDEPGRRR